MVNRAGQPRHKTPYGIYYILFRCSVNNMYQVPYIWMRTWVINFIIIQDSVPHGMNGILLFVRV